MFEYFSHNYVWNLSVDIALESGGRIGEIDAMCRPLREAAARGEDAGTDTFMQSWKEMADRLVELADEDVAKGRRLSSGAKRRRAALYYLVAERMQSRHAPTRRAVYDTMRRTFAQAMADGQENCERVEIPYGDKTLAALFVRAVGVSGAAPCVAHVNGLDSCKELIYLSEIAQALAQRGVSSLIVDQPGTGEALRLHDIVAVHDSERWAGPIVDALEQRSDVDTTRIGILGVSLGGYYAPRAAAFEPRFALGAVWGANHDWGEMQKRRLAREGDRPVPHYWDHVQWVFGAPDMDAFMAFAPKMSLDGILDRVRIPFLVAHGENDRQIPVDYAHRTYDALVNSPKRELKIFTPREQGIEHVSLDNQANARDYIADWIAETFAELKS